MDDEAFQELLENARLAAAWLRGEDTAGRIIVVGEPDAREIGPTDAPPVKPDATSKAAATPRHQA